MGVIDTKYMKEREKSAKSVKNEKNEKNEKTEKNSKTEQNEKNLKTDSKTDFTDTKNVSSKKTSKNDSKQLGFKGRNSTVAKKTPSHITQKIKEELSMHSRTNVQLNLLMNKTMKWVMTQDFEENAKEDAQKLN